MLISSIGVTVPPMPTYNHTGQIVTDLERSKRDYQDVLGFKFW
jgi:hypothetical protein